MHETRPAGPADAAAIAAIHVRSWRWAYRDLLPESYLAGLSVERRERWWTGELAAPSRAGGETRVALLDGQVCGFASVGPGRDPDLEATGAWELFSIYLDPTVVGQGIGCDLLAAVLDDVPSGVPVVSLWVLAGNARGRAFYEAAGFVPDGHRQEIEIGGTAVTEVRYVRYPPA